MADKVFVGHEDVAFGCDAFGAAKVDTVGAAGGQGFFGAHGNEVALDLCYQTEGEAEDLAVDAVVELVFLFGGVYIDALLDADAHDFHDVSEGTTKARNLCNYQGIPSSEMPEHPAEFPQPHITLTAHHLCYPFIYRPAIYRCESLDFVLLIFNMLFFSADSYVTDNHSF